MPKVEFVRERLVRHVGDDNDLTLLQRRYRVEGHTDLLIMNIWMADWIADDEVQLDQWRKLQDEEARFATANPDLLKATYAEAFDID